MTHPFVWAVGILVVVGLAVTWLALRAHNLRIREHANDLGPVDYDHAALGEDGDAD